MKINMFPKVINKCNGPKKTIDTQGLKEYEEGNVLIHYWQECKLVQPFWRTVWPFPSIFQMFVLDQTIPLRKVTM